jgi:hypothetical protein
MIGSYFKQISMTFVCFLAFTSACADSNKKKKSSVASSKCGESAAPSSSASGSPVASSSASSSAAPSAAALYDDEGQEFMLADTAAALTFDDVKAIIKKESTACKTLDCTSYEVVKTNVLAIMNGLPATTLGAEFKKIISWLTGGMLPGATAPTSSTSAEATGSPIASSSTSGSADSTDCL